MRERIFVTLGSQKFQFNRLLKAVDELCENNIIDSQSVFAQIGYSDYVPKNYQYDFFLDRDKFSMEMKRADIVITHGGTGAIIGAVKMGKKVIAVPRLAKYGEHVDDHQLQIVNQFESLDIVCSSTNLTDLSNLLEIVKKRNFRKYKSNTERIINSINTFIEENIL